MFFRRYNSYICEQDFENKSQYYTQYYNSVIHTDGWKAYDGLILNGYDHYRVHHNSNEFARGKNHVNGIESFWSYAKRRMAKFNGLTGGNFLLHLKESECRFNNRGNDFTSFINNIYLKN